MACLDPKDYLDVEIDQVCKHYNSGHTLRTPFGKRMVETSAAECVLSIRLEHLKKNIHLEHVLKGT